MKQNLIMLAGGIVACLFILVGINLYGDSRERDGMAAAEAVYKKKLDDQRNQYTTDLLVLRQDRDDREDIYRRNLAELETRGYNEKVAIEKSAADTIAKYRSGELRLKSEVAALIGSRDRMSATISAAGMGESKGDAKLLEQHVTFLVREAARADEYANQVNFLLDITAQDRLICNGSE